MVALNSHLTRPCGHAGYLACIMIINFNDTESARLKVLQDSRKIKQLINWLHAIDQAKNRNWDSDVCVDIFLDDNDISIHISEENFKNAVKQLYLQIPGADPLD